jgi:SAM-dependent methyltransferase
MHIKQHTSSLLELIRYANKDKSLELEARLKNTQTNEINSEVFFNVMKRLKGTRGLVLQEELTELDIGLVDDYNGIRVTITGDQHITDYCKKNDIKLLNQGAVSFMKKTPIRYVDVNEYNMKFNLKREEILPRTDSDISDIIKNWTRLDKTFRYKKRFSFVTTDGAYRFDLTTLKTSSKKTIQGKNKKMKKKDIKSYMVKYVVKPEYVVDTNDWLSKQPDTANIEMRGKNYEVLQPFKSLQKSQVLKNELEYEIELEYLGNNQNSKGTRDKEILSQFLQNLIIILQAVQKSYYIISELERMSVIDQYKALIGDYKFNGPMNVSLTPQHIIEKNYDEYQDSISIRKGYAVTDKADGERNLLLILKGGEMYLFNRKNHVRTVGAKCPSLENSIFDAEYVMKDKNGKNANMLLLFDVYFVNGEDVRDRILNRTDDEARKDIIPQSRYEIILEKMNSFETDLQKNDSNTLEIIRKKFYFGDDDSINPDTLTTINSITALLADMDPTSAEYAQNKEQLSILKADTTIFKEAHKVYTKEYPYHIDGLVFTPRKLAVGDEPTRDKRNKFNGRWYNCLKWKPPEENSIDFLGVFKKKEGSNDFDTKYLTINNNVIECRILVLHVGYNPIQHTKYNSFKVLNENVTFANGYNPTPFVPIEPYIRDIHLCYLPIENGNCYTEDKNIISDNSIIEFSYNNKKDTGVCWIPMRVRDTLKPNDFITANNVWKSIFNPVTLEMITTGNVDVKSNVYYDNTKKRSNKQSKPMNDFHSFIKKQLLKDHLHGQKTILDIGVGKAGDLNHWLDAGCTMIVGIDSVKDNLDNSDNGACNRILNKYSGINNVSQMNNSNSNSNSNSSKERPSIKTLLDNSLMVWADCSKNILTSEAAQDDINKFYLDILYGRAQEAEIKNIKLKTFYNQGRNFDLVVSNFAIHYFFESEQTLRTVLENISNSLKSGGRFVCTTLNGDKVFDILKYNRVYHSSELSWKISKKYTQDTFPNSVRSLGYKIEIYIDSIGQSLDEYLVNTELFEDLCNEYDLKLIDKKEFGDIYTKVSGSKVTYGDMLKMDDNYKTYSFLNMCMVFERK